MSGISSVGNSQVVLPANVQSALNAVLKTDAELLEVITEIATGQKASNSGLGTLVDLSV